MTDKSQTTRIGAYSSFMQTTFFWNIRKFIFGAESWRIVERILIDQVFISVGGITDMNAGAADLAGLSGLGRRRAKSS